MSWLRPRRALEGWADHLAVTGAAGGYVTDPVDGDIGFRRAGGGQRAVPEFTTQRARALSVSLYRANPMARAIVDTFTAFCVGDSGVTLECTNPDVERAAALFWGDHRNRLASRQESLLRGNLLLGETVLQMLAGPKPGDVRFAYLDPDAVTGVRNVANNPLWPGAVVLRQVDGTDIELPIVQIDDDTGLRDGRSMFWPLFKALPDDMRGMPFLSDVVDWIEGYDQVLWNLLDRTALQRYLVFDVTVNGTAEDLRRFVEARGSNQPPKSGSLEVHNENVAWDIKTAPVGAAEDTMTAGAFLTNIAAGTGLSKPWLAEAEDANRATSLTMAEPVRRRIGQVQKAWLECQTELVRFAVDRAVAAGRLPAEVPVYAGGEPTGERRLAAECVTVSGPEIAAPDALIGAQVFAQLASSLQTLQACGLLSPEAARLAVAHAWENFTGSPWRPELAATDATNTDLLAGLLSSQPPGGMFGTIGAPRHVPQGTAAPMTPATPSAP